MFNKILIGLIALVIFTKCNDKNVKENLFTRTNELNIKVLVPDSIPGDSSVYIPIVINNPKYKLYEVVLNGNITDTTMADTSKSTLFPLLTHLVISYDTTMFWTTTGNIPGKFTNDVTLIVQDQDKKFYYQKVRFDYYVK